MALQTHEAVDLGASLARALSYVNAWKRKSVVVKYGGSVLAGEDQGTLIEDLVLLKGAGVDPVLVHGGGPEITCPSAGSKKPSWHGHSIRPDAGFHFTIQARWVQTAEYARRPAGELSTRAG